MRYLLLCAVLVHYARGQSAPSDFDNLRCPRSYPSNWVVLFDSFKYDTLYDTRWLLRSNDGDSDGVS